jgi:hypothetical protein
MLSIAEADAKALKKLKDRSSSCKKHGIAPPKAEDAPPGRHRVLRRCHVRYLHQLRPGPDRAIATKLRDLGYPGTFAAQRCSTPSPPIHCARRGATPSSACRIPRHKKVLLALLNGVTKCTPRHPSLSVKPRTVRAGFREYKTAAKRGAR